MEEKRTNLWENGLIWFGAAVSVAEILTGTYFAPLGLQKGLLAIVLGHVIGCALLYFVGVIGGETRRSAMETVKLSLVYSRLGAAYLGVWACTSLIPVMIAPLPKALAALLLSSVPMVPAVLEMRPPLM